MIMSFIPINQPGRWIRKSDMPTARFAHTLSEVDGKLYALGGYPIANAERLKTVEIYDPAADRWSVGTPMPTGRRAHAACVVDGKIYAIGGYTNFGQPGLPTVEVYDPISDTWSTGTRLSEPRIGTAAAIHGKIYLTGGILTVRPPHPAVNWVEEYTPANKHLYTPE
jgi:N-acetylneuraminic acid mutarotase